MSIKASSAHAGAHNTLTARQQLEAAREAEAMLAATQSSPRMRALPLRAAELRTPRLVLRPRVDPRSLPQGDTTRSATSTGEPTDEQRAEAAQYLQWEAHDEAQALDEYAARRARDRLEVDGDGLTFTVELPNDDGSGRVIGQASIFLASAASAQMEIGWVFHPAMHGRGYAAEAVEALLRLCFETLDAHRVMVKLDPRNEASARLCESLGMRREGRMAENTFTDDAWRDTSIHAILHREWAAITC
ncbi:MAG TPA: GNAT family protein [Microbacteriaceae bacterium]|nr:GNAT family protein [Microbacteriaceae bacterium]